MPRPTTPQKSRNSGAPSKDGDLIETSSPTIDVPRHGFDGDIKDGDIVEFFREHPNGTFVLTKGEYAVESQLDKTNPDQDYRELQVIGQPHARLVVRDEGVGRLLYLRNTRGGAFARLSLRNPSPVEKLG